jgi:hypothetical protein
VHVGAEDDEFASDRNVNDQDTANHAADGGCRNPRSRGS